MNVLLWYQTKPRQTRYTTSCLNNLSTITNYGYMLEEHVQHLSILQKFEVVLPEFFQIPHMFFMFCLQLCLRQELQRLQEFPYQRVPMSAPYWHSLIWYAISSWLSGSWFLTKAAGKKRSERYCVSCRDHKCDKAITCAGKGCSLCKCTDHPITKNPHVRTTWYQIWFIFLLWFNMSYAIFSFLFWLWI